MNYMNLIVAGAVIGLSACGDMMATQGGNTPADCAPIKGLEAALDNPLPRVIILGELHGITEPPKFAEALSCHSLARGYRTALGLEMSDDDAGRIATFLQSNGDAAAQAALFEHNSWQSAFTDGRTSEAMLGLLDYARSQQDNPAFTPFLFQETDADFSLYATDPNGVLGDNERGMAENILTVARRDTVDKTIVLVGSRHASRARLNIGNFDYDFMGVHMSAPETLTLFNVYTAGTSWNCRGGVDEQSICGPNETAGYIDPESELAKTGEYEIITQTDARLAEPLNAAIGDEYDGFFYVGASLASPPVNLDGRKDE